MAEKIAYFEYNPRPWQREALERLEKTRFSVIVAHRRAGKTEAVCLRLLMAAMRMERDHPAPFFAYIAPFLNQGKAVAWDRLKYFARNLPGLKTSESELSLTLWNGAAIRVFGADSPDRLRGLGFDGVVMDEVAQMRPEAWPAVVRPALADRSGWAAFIGTPKGQNSFFELFTAAAKASADDNTWWAGLFPADKTGVIGAAELARLKAEMSEDLFRQEFLCDFTAGNHNAFIDFTFVQRAAGEGGAGPDDPAAPLVFGLDPARFGDDRTALALRRGRRLLSVQSWRKEDLMFTASRVSELINKLRPQAVFVDSAGLGGGVVDRLRQLGHRAIGINSGARPRRPDKFANLKAEMWSLMRDWLAEGAAMPDDQNLKADLLAPTYDYDHLGRLRLEGKDDLKKRGLPSPDLADALALTFAQPVASKALLNRRPKFAEMD